MAKPDGVFGFNVIGPVSSNIGLGVIARNVVRVLAKRGYPVALLDIDPGWGRGGRDLTYQRLLVDAETDLPDGINLHVSSITELPEFVINHPKLFGPKTFNVGFFMWELPVLPPVWKCALEFFDVLIAGSDFLRGTFENALSLIPIISATQPFEVPKGVRSDRLRFEIPNDVVAFICIVDPMSDPERKNPFGAIDAFLKAFRSNDQVRLVVKLNNASPNGKDHRLIPKVRAHCQVDPRIRVIDEVLNYRDVLSLYASCDVFIALHRSEGIGLGPLEAMALGKPVIATGWSGNMTYMDHCNSCVVRYRLIPAAGSIRFYTRQFLGEEAVWADPDIEHAAAWMKRLAGDAQLRAAIGRRAAESIAAFIADGECARFADELHEIWQNRKLVPSDRRYQERDLSELREAAFEHTASRAEIIARKGRRMLDRHLLWRFRRS